MTGALLFNGNNLQTFTPTLGVGIITNVINHTGPPDSVFDLLQVANANRSSLTDIDSPSKTITIAGFIKGSSRTDLDQRIDAFNAYFNGKNKDLDINFAGSTRRYTATAPPSNVKVDPPDGKLFTAFSVQFVCTDPFGRDTALTTLFTQANRTTATYTAAPTVGGSAPYQLPIFTITLDALTGSGDFVQISNNANNQAILIFGQSLAAGDTLIIDSEKHEVKRNGVLIDYTGIFLELEPGLASISYSDGFTTRQVDIDGKYYKRYK